MLFRSDGVSALLERARKAAFPAAVRLGRDVRDGALPLDKVADRIAVICLVGEHDGARTEVVEQRIGDLAVVPLPGG